jgi:hypothetical protein
MSTATGATPPAGTTGGSPARVGSIVLLVLGSLLGLIGLGVLAAGTALATLSAGQDDDGFYTTPPTTFAVDSYALTSPRFDITGDAWVPPAVPFDIATFRLQASPVESGKGVFIGIAQSNDVDRYLASVHHSELRDLDYRPFRVEYRDVPGTETPESPAAQDFWIESASGTGTQEIEWQPETGDWSVVVMNEDASSGVSVKLSAGLHTDLLWPLVTGFLIGGSILLLAGIAMVIPGAIGLGRQAAPTQRVSASGASTETARTDAEAAATGVLPASAIQQFPVRLTGVQDPVLSRWLWLVKWLLAIPHYIILALLWFAFLVTTIVAGFAILFTGRYPKALFHFNVGVLRWNWRVAFYAYSALGTDQYPPFTLARTPYPADFEVDYPERLSNGLVLVKWWLLALPHLLIVAVFTGGAGWWFWPGRWGEDSWRGGLSLLGVLVLIAAVMLLFTGTYRRSLFDFVLGINRWIYRVLAYVALLRDEYPPFRLDQGPLDQGPLEQKP